MKNVFKIIICFSVLSSMVVPSKSFAQVVINEFLPNPAEGEKDWVELYSETDVDISGWVLDDDNTISAMETIPEGITIGSSTNKHYIVEVGTRLNQSGDTIYLNNSSSSLIDSRSYSYNPGTNTSFGRFPDGGSWGVCQPTEGSANANCFFPSPTPTPNPTPTPDPTPQVDPSPTPKATSSPNPTLKPSPKPTIKASSSPIASIKNSPTQTPVPSEQVLSETTGLVSPESTVLGESTKSGSLKIPMGIIFMIVGILLSGGAGFLAYKQNQKQKLV